eukprot:168738_1
MDGSRWNNERKWNHSFGGNDVVVFVVVMVWILQPINMNWDGSNPLNSQLIVAINTTANAFFTPHCPLEHVMGWGNNRCQCHGSTGNGQWCGAALGRLMPFDGCFVLLQRMVVVEQECVL